MRGGCACAGPYVHRLLGLDRDASDRLRAAILADPQAQDLPLKLRTLALGADAPANEAIAPYIITGRAKPVHDGRWGLANLELCLAAIESSKRGEEIQLKHQVAAT